MNRITMTRLISGLILFLGTVLEAHAGWLTLRNDTEITIIVQEIVLVDKQPRRSAPQRIFAGETVRFLHTANGETKLLIAEDRPGNRILFADHYPGNDTDNPSIVIQFSNGKIRVVALTTGRK